MLTGGELTTIAWSSEPGARSFKLKYSRNNGHSWSLIDMVEAPATALEWQVPHLLTVKPESLVQLVAYAGPAGTGERLSVKRSETFTVRPVAVTLTAPQGGETLTSGEQVAVAWTPASRANRYELFFSGDDGASWQLIAKVRNVAGYLWTVPQVPAVVPAARLKVKAFFKQAKLSVDVTDTAFTIVPDGIIPPPDLTDP